MTNNSNLKNVAFVDNWMLELASAALSENLGSFSRKGPDAVVLEGKAEVYSRKILIREQILALLQVLDLMVLYDNIVYDKAFEYVWSRSRLLAPLVEVLQSFELTDETKVKLGDYSGIHYLDDPPEYYIKNAVPAYPQWMDEEYNKIIMKGAHYYLSLSEVLGVAYWPCPARAKFIKENLMNSTSSNFIYSFNATVNERASKLVESVLEGLVGNIEMPMFAGFGSSILSMCKSRSEIIPTALQFRNSSSAKSFRKWLSEMESSFEQGDAMLIAKGLEDVNESLSWASNELGIDMRKEDGITLQIGIVPALNIEGSVIKEAMGWLRKKPMHVTFFREHFGNVLRSSNLISSINRLYPEADNINVF